MLYLLISGDMMKPSGWLISIERHGVMGPHPFLLHGVAACLAYPAAGSSRLEFIQRCFQGINRERGSKTKKRTTMNPHVSTLLRKLRLRSHCRLKRPNSDLFCPYATCI
ncbi:hypothetical protein DPEC_G00376740 [Dallia pectoralis]|nr:hypothetical protein DPEC_G00376740 [Dallia pectoralis]